MVRIDVRRGGRNAGSGSGVIVSSDGLALTNSHVVQGARVVSLITLEGRDLQARVLGDEAIIMSTADSTIFMLNSTGTVIWQAADGNTPLSRIIVEKLCEQFDVPVEQAAADAEDFVAQMAAHGVLVVSEEPIPR